MTPAEATPDRTPRPRNDGAPITWHFALLALASAVVGAWIAWHYPLAWPAAPVLFALLTLVTYRWPCAWLVWLPAALPVVGLATWTGWITFEEFDLLVLAVAAGGYARRVVGRELGSEAARAPRSAGSALVWVAIGAFALDVLASMFRGFADAGGFSFGWYQGYREPMNSLRLAKPLFAALLLWPLWNLAYTQAPHRSAEQLSTGMMLGLLLASLMTVWERLAFTGLLNFSTDYRTTALFWEMHVGGAALDGYLALTVPFAVQQLLAARTQARWLVAAGVSVIALYACLTTFSRGVYLGVPIGAAITIVLYQLQLRRSDPARAAAAWRSSLRPRLGVVAGFAACAAIVFPGSGYRGMAAILGAWIVLLPLAAALREGSRADRISGFSLGVVFALLGSGIAWLIPKGPYLVYGASVLFALGMLWLHTRPAPAARRLPALPLALAAYGLVLASTGMVALNWGGESAVRHALPVLVALLLIAVAGGHLRQPLWPADFRWQGNTLAAAIAAGGLVATASGGAYLSDRFSTSHEDLQGRLKHWQLSLSMLDGTPNLLFGKGLGRYADNYAIAAPEEVRPGDYRLHAGSADPYVALISARRFLHNTEHYAEALGDVLRLSQRTSAPMGAPTLTLVARSEQAAVLNASFCKKHLLYSHACLGTALKLDARPGEWQEVHARLSGPLPTRGDWFAPALFAFSISVSTADRTVEIRRASLSDPTGDELLANGAFSSGLSHWYVTSDHNHLPWHAKNMALHVALDQGLLGLTLLALLYLPAILRPAVGSARACALAPVIVGSLIGFSFVGLFDSLLDIPRVAFLFFWLLLLGSTLRPPESALVSPG